jgi:prepilin-type N-terminal cleavage/methylation domain-containing protein
MKGKMINKNKGFSLVELIIIIAIMSILAASISMALIRYIDKAKKAVDLQTAETIYNAANLAAATASNDAAAGWSICAKNGTSYRGTVAVTNDGYRAFDGYWNGVYTPTGTTYVIQPVAWARGIRNDGAYGSWENTMFKATIDSATGDGALQRAYTDEFLSNLFHDGAQGGYNEQGHRTYDGETMSLLKISYRKLTKVKKSEVQDQRAFKESSYDGRKYPECWILYRRMDTGEPEVWIGFKGNTNQSIEPLYRLYPDPCPAYQ